MSESAASRQFLTAPPPCPETERGWRGVFRQGKIESALVGAVAAFVAYFSMCAFRRPFMVLEFKAQTLGSSPIELKTALIISQILGYGVSKYLGISFCSQISRQRMWLMLVILIGLAELGLILFATLPGNWMLVAMFVNGLPLGMIWGLMVRYLEGRQLSDVMLAVLSCSFILGSGVVKDVGRWLMRDMGVSDLWMPAAAGLCFLPPFLLAILFLHRLPQPDQQDQELRHARVPMSSRDRKTFFWKYALTLIPLLAFYFLLTAFRDFRDLYAVEIVKELGYGEVPAVLTRIELPIAILVTVVLGALTLIRNNQRALWAIYAVMFSGMLTIGAATLLQHSQMINGMTWMVMMGMGAYLGYVPYNAVLFERFMASTRATGNAVFGIYLADALGYTGSIGLQLLKDINFSGSSRLQFFESFAIVMSVGGSLCLLGSMWHLRTSLPRQNQPVQQGQPALAAE
ncbi:DUF5690 family protein [Planctomicrobium sp. SH664]|uniref:DUF5690 family protein n=1 Tax=Planctomicrobium sp. SH664 TaxID=3448125 RepID=UPI003F5B5876